MQYFKTQPTLLEENKGSIIEFHLENEEHINCISCKRASSVPESGNDLRSCSFVLQNRVVGPMFDVTEGNTNNNC